ncbi:GNAT family N-acetyltransferase [Sulfitobacter sp.]|uniref:GNAT family N-acetyltransferase n=1 Tax=Sulfitobacter sp. TaxID=1903071 RepID=UPI003001536D
MIQIEIRPFTADDRDWLVASHIEIYEKEEGFDASFGVLVAQIIDDFLAKHDPQSERGWIAWDGAQRLGSIFCVRMGPQTAKLRLFQLLPQARGLGLGHLMLQTCTEFARAHGYTEMKLSTHKSHEAANALYLRNGWEIIDEQAITNYGQLLIERVMRLSL